jgi:hypothetical protein
MSEGVHRQSSVTLSVLSLPPTAFDFTAISSTIIQSIWLSERVSFLF